MDNLTQPNSGHKIIRRGLRHSRNIARLLFCFGVLASFSGIPIAKACDPSSLTGLYFFKELFVNWQPTDISEFMRNDDNLVAGTAKVYTPALTVNSQISFSPTSLYVCSDPTCTGGGGGGDAFRDRASRVRTGPADGLLLARRPELLHGHFDELE